MDRGVCRVMEAGVSVCGDLMAPPVNTSLPWTGLENILMWGANHELGSVFNTVQSHLEALAWGVKTESAPHRDSHSCSGR